MTDKEFRDQLFLKQKHAFDLMDDAERKLSDDYCEKYKKFIDTARTEREAVTEAIRLAEGVGFKEFDRNSELKAKRRRSYRRGACGFTEARSQADTAL